MIMSLWPSVGPDCMTIADLRDKYPSLNFRGEGWYLHEGDVILFVRHEHPDLRDMYHVYVYLKRNPLPDLDQLLRLKRYAD